MNFNKLFKIVSISLFAIAIIASVMYIGAASKKNCFACKLPVCEKVDAKGEKYLAPADECAMTYNEIKKMEQETMQRNKDFGTNDPVEISECSKECLNYAGNFMMFTIVITIVAIVLALLFSVYMLIVDTKKIKGVLIGVGSIGLITLISYLMSSDSIPSILGYSNVITIGEVKMVDTMLFMTYILLAISIISILYTSIVKIIKK
ncbi:MAG TPA: hypothetical protein P5243_02180 [Bacteroidales bacterium]|jgi:hypothetical protein|nr:hypothetical protein [Bacteroidales bacterium]